MPRLGILLAIVMAMTALVVTTTTSNDRIQANPGLDQFECDSPDADFTSEGYSCYNLYNRGQFDPDLPDDDIVGQVYLLLTEDDGLVIHLVVPGADYSTFVDGSVCLDDDDDINTILDCIGNTPAEETPGQNDVMDCSLVASPGTLDYRVDGLVAVQTTAISGENHLQVSLPNVSNCTEVVVHFNLDVSGDLSIVGFGQPGEPVAVLSVTKTADATYDCEYDWTIEKSVDPEALVLLDGGSATVEYTIVVTKSADCTPIAGSFEVTGTIEVVNEGPADAENVDLSDELSDGSIATISNCDVDGNDVTLPTDLLVGETLTCDYEATASGIDDGTNSATATADNAEDATGEADYTFAIDETLNDCVSVDDDTNDAGDRAQLCVTTDYSYEVEITADGCEQEVIVNTATVSSLDEGNEVLDSDDAAVTVDKVCVTVTKTAETSFEASCTWEIQKDVVGESSQTVEADGTATFSYQVTLEGSCDDISNAQVAGSITVSNDGTVDVTVESVTDALDDATNGVVSCDTDPPVVLSPGGSLGCTYTAAPADMSATLNTAIATVSAVGIDGTTDFSGDADVTWGGPTTITDECVDVSDDQLLAQTGDGDLGQFCVDDTLTFGPQVIATYDLDVGPVAACETAELTNTATATTTDTETEVSDSETVTVEAECLVFEGETAWAANGNTPGDIRYTQRGSWATYVDYRGFEDSGKTVTLFAGQTIAVGTVEFSAVVGGMVTITVTLTDPWEFEDLAANLMVQGYASAPSGNPSPGLFANKTGCDPDLTTCSITVAAANFYGVHVNVGQFVPAP